MAIELTANNFIDLLLRGANLGILLLIIAHLALRPNYDALVVTGLFFCVTGMIEIVLNAPSILELLHDETLLLLSFQQIHFISMWWFVRALFDDHFCLRPRCLWPVGVSAPLVLAVSMVPFDVIWAFKMALVALNAGLLIHVIYKAISSRAGDLVDARRAFSLALAFTVPPFMLLVFAVNLMGVRGPLNTTFCLVCGVVYFLLALVFSFWLTRLKGELFERNSHGSNSMASSNAEMSSADRLELERVVKAVDGGLYLEPGLTIGGLADVLQVPEHRLRKLINRGLGYRNFAAFINDYRIAEAKRRLSDPELAREQIIQHAFSLGYASLAPFNRAFRERVGVSPTEYREEALGGVTTH
ncbi:AraC-type DNA-binding domain-containing protein [Hoeflea phototrophica DFL-43]|uniref:AraC-type DNA-binding domain-containing protein n=1 Tax=Hoeflea phototrophica (strain DSM 17068 / NCIMB 14078 / DFL-43) TaxID=411684 RepID=A9D1U4_HOEPD|nr:AraC family transcriptional regulator [Hoeflea phototrophica]EDQ34498.1 AraC-type DNA-binding domain-containing protein [Hoeflea phototrophica DFL-43]